MKFENVSYKPQNSLREKCPNTEFFLVRIFLHSDTFHAVIILLESKDINPFMTEVVII